MSDLPILLAVLLGVVAFLVLAFGATQNWRSQRAGRGVDRDGIRIQLVTIGLILIVMSIVGMWGAFRAQVPIASVLFIPMTAIGGWFLWRARAWR